MPKSRKKKCSPKRVLALPDLEQSKTAVLNTLTSKSGQRSYDRAITDFVDWYCCAPRLAFNRPVVLRYRIYLEQQQYAATTINLRLAAVRRVTFEAADSGLLSPELAAGIRRVKDYEHAIQYFKGALRHDHKNARLYNKLGMTELKSGDFKGARNDFTQAAKYNHQLPEAWNNLGVTYYVEKNYASAAKYFKKAVALDETRPTYHVNLGVAWFAQNDLDRAMREYARALELDPDALVRSSRAGVDAQITNPEERAKHNYMMARVYAKLGNTDSCLVCLKKAKEDGYRDLEKVYKDKEFSSLWQDARLAAIVPPPAPR